MSTEQLEAMRLADRLEGRYALHPEVQEAAAELRRLHALVAAHEAEMAQAPPADPVAMWQFRHITEDSWRELVPRTGQTLETAINELLGYRIGVRRMYQVRPLFAAPAAPVAVPMALVQLPDPAEEWQAHNGPDEDGTVSLYTAEQMRQYALDFAAAHGIGKEGGQG